MVKKMDMERLNLKLNEEEVKEQYQVTIKNIVQLWKTKEDNGDIKRAWDAIRQKVKISAKESIGLRESKHHKPWFDEERLKLVD
jgi:Tfp pilus assembly protein PilO